MRALQVVERGQPPVLIEMEKPLPGPGEVQVRINACGLNFADLLMVSGTYQERPTLPFTLGLEVSGTITAHGARVSAPAIGTRVAVFGGQGGLAEYGCFAAPACVEIPAQMPTEHAAGFQVAYGTSHVALEYKARLQPGETLVVLGASGGVGLTAVEIGKLMGARVIACARGGDKLRIAQKAGADHLIDTSSEDLRDAVKTLGGADVVYDAVGGELGEAALRATNPDGRYLAIGFASGKVPEIRANYLLVKNIAVMGLYWGGYLKVRPEVLTTSMAQLLDWYTQGRLSPHISHTLPLERAHDALELLRTRRSTGKVVVTTG